jgi:hypothetical protein
VFRCYAVLLLVLLTWPTTADAQWYNDYKSLADYNARMDQMVAEHPDLASPISIGTSIEGRDIRGLRITGSGGSSVAKKTVVFHGLIHAREWIAGMTTMYAADNLLDEYATDMRVQNVLDNVEFLVIPVLNPDGYQYSRTPGNRFWRKNRRDNGNGTFGVDLNRNFDFNWGPGFGGSSGNSDSDVYRGVAPFSEPESQALRDLFLDNQQIVSHIDFHSYGQIIAGPWGYTLDNPPLVDILDRQAGIMAASVQSVHGEQYLWGDDTNVLGIANGITNDWAYGDQGVFSYTVELRPKSFFPGFDLPPAEILPTAEEIFPSVLDLGEFTMQLAAGDFNFDDQWTCADADALVDVIVHGSDRSEFDMDGDGKFSPADLDEWLAQAGARNLTSQNPYLVGDANLDGTVDGLDFVTWNDHRFTMDASYCRGDFNADGFIDASDFTEWNSNRFMSAGNVAVPEPILGGWLLIVICMICRWQRLATSRWQTNWTDVPICDA